MRRLHLADLSIVGRQVSLPAGIIRIDLAQVPRDGEAAAIGHKRVPRITLRCLNVTYSPKANRKVALPIAIIGIAAA